MPQHANKQERASPAQERASHTRGLLLLAALMLAVLLWRAHPAMHLFHPGWWRF